MKVNFRKIFFAAKLSACGILLFSAMPVAAQRPSATPTVIYAERRGPMPVAVGNNLYCAGYIQTAPVSTGNRLVGAAREADRFTYAEGDVLWINMGSNKGVNVGDMLAVIRPRGRVKSKWANKGNLGYYVQEVGAVEVVRVKNDVSAVRVKSSCDSFLLGDLVQPTAQRVSPLTDNSVPLDLFSDPTGKATGRILMARDGAEMLGRDMVAYVSVGADQNVQVGDKLTVYRPLGKGNLMKTPEKEQATGRDSGYQSEKYRGGKFSNQAGRKSGEYAQGDTVSSYDAKQGRTPLRSVVGEAVVVNVKEKTATVVITRNAAEIHTGDWVEVR